MRSWSVSSIRSFHGCQLAWWFRRTNVEPKFTPVALVEGITLHEALAHHLRGVRDGVVPGAAEIHDLIEAVWFVQESGTPIKYGRLDREACLARLRRLHDHWREHAPIEGDVIAIESEIRAEFEGVDLPMLGYTDLVLRRGDEVHIVDFKVTAAKPSPDPVMDPLDLQALALTRGYEVQHNTPVAGWAWQHLVKTKEPQVVDNALPVSGCDRVADIARLAAVVRPTIVAMEDVLEGRRAPVPTQAPFTMCSGCSYRGPCAAWIG